MPFIGERLGCAREKSNREDPFAVAMKRGTETVGYVPRTISCVCTLFLWQRVFISCEVTESSRPSVDLSQFLVMHDVIDWLELCTCPFTVTLKCSRTKYSRMAADPRKPRTLNPAKIKAHTVHDTPEGEFFDERNKTVSKVNYLYKQLTEELHSG